MQAAMLLFSLLSYLQASSALLQTGDDRISTRNITCRHDTPFSTSFSQNCEACLVTSRNYVVETALSLTGAGLAGFTYSCLSVNDVEAYHENLVRECRYYPQNTLNGHDDFCIATPYNIVRGSYRACICLTNLCNFNFTLCQRQLRPVWSPKVPVFAKTIQPLTHRVSCHRTSEDPTEALCPPENDLCKNYLFDQAVLCSISVDRTGNVTRQTFVPSIYTAHLLKYKTQLCASYTYTSQSITFSQCQSHDSVCMCAFNECNRDLATCSKSEATFVGIHAFSILLLFTLCFYLYRMI